jgi:hypothetical protein
MSEDAGESVKASSSCGGVARTKVNFQSRLILKAIFQAELDQPWRQCAVKRRWSSAGQKSRPGTGSLHPVAIGAAAEATKLLKPSV